MNILKTFIIILPLLCNLSFIKAMDGADPKSIVRKVLDFPDDHPIATLAIVAGSLGGYGLWNMYKTAKKKDAYYREHGTKHQLFEAVQNDDLEGVRRALITVDINQGVTSWFIEGFMPQNALGFASAVGNKKMVEWLLAHGAKRNVLLGIGESEARAQTSGGSLGLALSRASHGSKKVQQQIQLLLTTCSKNYQKPFNNAYFGKKVHTLLCIFKYGNKDTGLPVIPKDIQLLILSYLPETATSQEHCRLLLNKGANLKVLIHKCPFDWFKAIYSQSDKDVQPKLLEKLVPLFLEKHIDEVVEELRDIAQYIPADNVQIAYDIIQDESTIKLIEDNIVLSLSN